MRYLTDIEQDDIDIASRNLRKCAAIAELHASSAETAEIIPGVKEFRSDIAELEKWISAIRDRRTALSL